MLSELAVVAALATQPICYLDRNDERKPAQMAAIAGSVAIVSDTPDEAAFLLTIGYFESRWCLVVHSGEHKGKGRGLWQLEGRSKQYPGPFVGLDSYSTLNSAWVALDIVRHSWQCGPSVANRFSAYGGRPCDLVTWKTLPGRVRAFHYLRSVIVREIEKQKREAA